MEIPSVKELEKSLVGGDTVVTLNDKFVSKLQESKLSKPEEIKFLVDEFRENLYSARKNTRNKIPQVKIKPEGCGVKPPLFGPKAEESGPAPDQKRKPGDEPPPWSYFTKR